MWEVLWRRTVTLARGYPALWLPVVGAELAGVGLRSIKSALKPYLLQFAFNHRSVLGGNAIDYSQPNLVRASALGGGLELTVQFATVALYVIALFLTASMVRRRTGDERAGADGVPVKRALQLTVKAFAFVVVLTVIFMLAIDVPLMRSRWHAVLDWWLSIDLFSLLLMLVLACLLVPSAMKAISAPRAEVDQRSIQLGRKSACASVVVSISLMILWHVVIRSFMRSRAEASFAQAMQSVLIALPYAPLYIAFALLVEEERPVSIEA